MAWRPYQNLIEGELDNTTPGEVSGWIKFVGMKEVVKIELAGNFHRDIRGAKIRFHNPNPSEASQGGPDQGNSPGSYMDGFSPIQTGKVGDITAGLPPADYLRRPYVEWYSHQNGRVVLEMSPEQVEVIGKPIPAIESDPISREEQAANMASFLAGLARDFNIPAKKMFCAVATPQRNAAPTRRHKLLTQEIRKKLPPLSSQDGLGGKAVAHVKFFLPGTGWNWHASEGSAEGDDFIFFGLVEGHCRELGLFSLRELESVRGPLGLPIERDLYWTPKMLEEIAPEMFSQAEKGGDARC